MNMRWWSRSIETICRWPYLYCINLRQMQNVLAMISSCYAHFAMDDGRRDTIDRDAVRRQFHRVLLDQHHKTALGRAIGGIAPRPQP